ncbi:helix-turn-helix domain-containing protein [Gemmatimonadota bacterium]
MAGMMTTRDLQELLQVDRSTIYRMAESGRIPAVKVGKQWRFPADKVTAWLELRTASSDEESPARNGSSHRSFEQLIPLTCAQTLLDAFAEVLEVSLIITDMRGEPLSEPSNPIKLFRLLDRTELGHSICKERWRQLARDPDREPRFAPGFGGMLCARALVLLDHDPMAMVVAFGIAPDDWPPQQDAIRDLAVQMKMPASRLKPTLMDIPMLSADERRRTLSALQRIADVLSMFGQERCGLTDRLSSIAELSAY